jgi:hypothetical protein
MRARRTTAALSIVAFALSFTTSATADEAPSASEIAAARGLGIEGIRLADAHDCEQAVDRLTRAEHLYHAPTTLERLAECQIELGRVVEGTENLQRVLREQLPPKPPAAFVYARARAERALAAALPKIAKLRIVIGPPGVKATVLLDGEPVAPALLDVDRPTDPGEHKLEISAPGFAKSESSLTLAPGERRTLPVALARDGAEATPAAPASPAPVLPEPPAPRSNTAGFVMLGVGAAGLVAGSVLGGVYFSRKNDFDSQCPGATCGPGASISEEEVGTLRAGAIGALVVGGTSLVIAVILLATGGGDPVASAQTTRAGIFRF